MPHSVSAPEVQTEGGWVRGFWRGKRLLNMAADPAQVLADSSAHVPHLDEDPLGAVFLGIPYAQDPVGALRFAAPAPVEPWQGTRDCSRYGPTPLLRTAENSLIPEPAFPGESTLNLNLFTPVIDANAALPVLVYIHGGGYTSGSPSSPWYDGRSFNRDGVVTVSVSYRLGLTGFGQVDGAPANRGVLDWIAALHWVQRNIAAFGGDPNRVTIAGQSAGGGAVLTLLGMEAAQSLFAAAWCLSGAIADIEPSRAEENARIIAKQLSVAPTAAGFGSVPPEKMAAAEDTLIERALKRVVARVRKNPADIIEFGPVVDGKILARPTLESLTLGIGADKPLLLGATADEFMMMADELPPLLNKVSPNVVLAVLGLKRGLRHRYLRLCGREGAAQVTAGYLTDILFRTPALEVANVRGPSPTWLYSFDWVGTKRGYAIHCSDVPFWFDCLDQPYTEWLLGARRPQSLADSLHAAAVSFVSSEDPGWPAYRAGRGEIMVFDRHGAEVLSPNGFAAAGVLVD